MKKIFILLLIVILLFSCLTACKANNDPTFDPNTSTTETLPFENVEDKGEVEFEKEYTIDEILKIKTNWNKEYVFTKDIENVIIDKKDNKNIEMSLTTTKQSFDDAVAFYQKYTENKENKNFTKTPESYFVSFVDDYVIRTILVIKNKDNIHIEISYSLENVNKR